MDSEQAAAMPKSHNATWPCLSTSTFAGLRSRWTCGGFAYRGRLHESRGVLMNRLHERRRQVVFFSNSGPLDAMLSPEPHLLDGVALPRHRRDGSISTQPRTTPCACK